MEKIPKIKDVVEIDIIVAKGYQSLY